VQDTFFGVSVTEDYRWLEADRDPAVMKWSDAQNGWARRYLDAITARADVHKRVQALESGRSPDHRQLTHRSGRWFALKEQPPKQQPFLVVLSEDLDPASEKIVVDPNALSTAGALAIDFYVPSLDGRRVAVSLSEHGSEDGSVRVYDVATGQALPDLVPGVNFGTAGGSVAWNRDGSGFWYTRYPRGRERRPEDMHFYQQIWFHKLGTATDADTYALGRDFPRIAEVKLTSREDGAYVLAEVANGDGGEFAYYLTDGRAAGWTEVARFADRVIAARFGRAGDPSLYLLSRKTAPRGKLLTVPLDAPRLAQARVLVPERDGVLQEFVPTRSLLYLTYLVGGPSELYRFDKGGSGPGMKLPTTPVSSVGDLVAGAGDALLFRSESFIDAPAWYAVDARAAAARRTQLQRAPVADFSDTEVVRVVATSKDGTKVPLNIIRKKGTKLDRKSPTILSGYGGYGISREPRYSDTRRVWIEQGGVYAIANLRGGGEFGEAWHLGGNLTHKQNVFDDFYACAQLLKAEGYAGPEKLAILGGSNGGLLMGAAFTQHPEAYRAVVSLVGIYDMLRVELSPNGAFNVTEFGTVKNEAQWRALFAYSPYHHVVDRAPYPSILFLTGANDPRVEPMQSRKMTARLQAAIGSLNPVLLRTSSSSGHGIGTALAEQIEEDADVYAFLFHELGVPYQPVAPR
jgi:prolyl oligopeptidase